MKLSFANRKLQDQCNTDSACIRTFGAERAKHLKRRLGQMQACAHLGELLTFPGGFHALKGGKSPIFAASISANYRLLFEPDCHPIPKLSSGGINCHLITALRILSIEDYHEH